MLNILSLGAGVQSTVLALMSARGELDMPIPDYAIFADTKFEPIGVYEHLDWLEKQLPFKVIRVSKGDIRQDHLDGINTTGQKFASMPLYVENGGVGRRQCTMEYKIAPINKMVRELMGLGFRQRAKKGVQVKMWIGISTDEATRMKPSRLPYIENIWPLIDKSMSRSSCIRWFAQRYPGRTLAKSACIACPYHSDATWRDMKMNDPASFSQAVEFDAAIRESGAKFSKMRNLQYVHRSCQPLDKVDFRNLEDKGQINMFENECEGMCGV